MRQPHLADRDLTWSPLNKMPSWHLNTGIVNWDAHPRKLCIYGAGFGREHAPLDDPEWTVWALNLVAPYDKAGRVRADAWFDLHQKVAQTEDDLRWIAKCPVPIYLPDDLLSQSPNALRFPVDKLEREFKVSYWACTFAYQIALAMHHGFTTIGLFGVELAYGPERECTVEWANTSFWIGMAVAKGIKIMTPPQSRLGTHPFRYGLEYEEEIEDVETYLSLREHLEDLSKRAGIGG